MHVLIDAQALQSSATRNRGIGRYSRNLIAALVTARPAWRIELIQSAHLEPIELDLLPAIPNRLFSPPFDVDVDALEANERYYADWLTAAEPDGILLLSCFDSCVLAPRFEGPRPRLLAVLYDLTPLVRHDHYLDGQRERTSYARRFRALLGCDEILASSEATARDLQYLATREHRRITVIKGAADACFRYSASARFATEHQRVAEKFGLSGDFLLHVGGGDYRKNLEGSLRAFAALSPAGTANLALVIVGQFSAEQRASLVSLAQKLGIEGALRAVGFVTDEELRVLYQSCRLMLFPSLHEGLGLPVLEALGCGAPVVASNRSSIPEYAGQVCHLADPGDSASFATAITEALAEPREQRLNDRLLQASRFTWLQTGEEVCRVVERPDTTVKLSRARRRIAWVSPLPPCPSGIADYSADLLPHLANQFDIELVIDPNDTRVAADLAETYPVLLASEVSKRHEARPYDLFVFQLGNSHFHLYMLDLIRRYQSLVVLHELSLGGLVEAAIRAGLWRATYDEELPGAEREPHDASPKSDDHEEATWEEASRRLLNLAEGIVVHSTWTWQRVRRLVSVPTCLVQQAVPIPSLGTRGEERRRLGLAEDLLIVATFGQVRPSKHVDCIIRAVVAQHFELRRKIQVLVVGGVDDDLQKDLLALAQQLGIAPQLKFLGRVPLEDFSAYARAADVCVQLRQPTRGETSAALLRALAAGGACIVSAHGPMAELPDSVALQVRFGDGAVPELAAALRRLLESLELRTQLGRAAVDYIRERHGVRETAARYAAMIELTAARRGARDALWLEGACDGLAACEPELVTSLIQSWAELRLKGQRALQRRHSPALETQMPAEL